MNILIIDDSESAVMILEHLLMARGHTVYKASSKKQADELIRSLELDIAIVDISLPEMRGDEWVEFIKKSGLYFSKHCVFVASTAYMSHEFKKEVFEELLEKPISVEKIDDLLKRITSL